MSMIYFGYLRRFGISLAFYVDADSHALLNIENILILCTIWRALFLFAVAMQIKYVYLIKALHEALTHPPEGRIIQVAMIGDEGKNTITCLLNAPLCKANKLYII